MSQKRQQPLYNPQGAPTAELTTLSWDFKDGDVVPPHFHPENQVVFASQGVMTVRTDDGLWVVPPLRAVWIPGHVVHSIAMSGAVSLRTLYLAPALAASMAKTCVVINVPPLLRELILHACSRQDWSNEIPAERRIIEVLLDQLTDASTIPLQLPRPKDPRANRIVDQLLADPSDNRPLTELCKGTGGSKRTIERTFVDETGMTFGKWRQQLRLLHGMRLLAAGEKVTAAALDCGYESPSAFIAVFKKAFGQTPMQYLQLTSIGAPPAVYRVRT
jgi:AraC-like DNA-binding protein